jgi:hypothetical protein
VAEQRLVGQFEFVEWTSDNNHDARCAKDLHLVKRSQRFGSPGQRKAHPPKGTSNLTQRTVTCAHAANSGSKLRKVEIWPIDRLVFYARNPRKNDSVVDRTCSSIREFGFKIPVLERSDGEVVDGHLRLKAAQKLRITEVPVILCD